MLQHDAFPGRGGTYIMWEVTCAGGSRMGGSFGD